MEKLMMNNDKYYEVLLDQFLKAKGNLMSIKSNSFISEFSEWLIKREEIGKRYLEYLYVISSKEIVDNEKTFEIGKGLKDTVAKDLKTSLITPFGEELQFDKKKRIIIGDFWINRGIPCIRKQTENGEVVQKMKYTTNTFMIQNPYDEDDLLNWDYLRNGTTNNILVGMYGELKDKDYANKIKMLKDLRNKLVGKIKTEYIEENGNYYYLLDGEKQERFIKELNFRM